MDTIRSLKCLIVCFSVTFTLSAQSSQEISWHEISHKLSSSSAGNDYYGEDNAIAIDGDYAVIGSYMESKDASGGDSIKYAGAAYIFYRHQGGTDNWGEVMKIVAGDRHESDYFGSAVDISGDYIVVGAMRNEYDENGLNNVYLAGAAYIFKKLTGDPDSWAQIKKIVPSDRNIQYFFGESVSISGNTILVGSPDNQYDETGGGDYLTYSGAVYVFQKDQDGPDQWGELKKIVMPDRKQGAQFGGSVSLDGDYFVAGAEMDDFDENGEDSLWCAGAAYIYYKDQGSPNNWGFIKKIDASDRNKNDYFGGSVSISADKIIVGAHGQDLDADGQNYFSAAGAIYFFKKDYPGADQWGQVKKITPVGRGSGHLFGQALSISGDFIFGQSQWVNQEGVVFVFYKDYGGTDTWAEMEMLRASDHASNKYFGRGIQADQDYLIVAANYGTTVGESYVFKKRIQAGNIQITNLQHEQLTISWSNGNGDGRAVFMSENEPILVLPPDNTTYQADTVFGQGDQIGSDPTGYCIFNGTDTLVTVTGLQPGVTYAIVINEYSEIAGEEHYFPYDDDSNKALGTTLIFFTGAQTDIDDGLIKQTTNQMEYSLNSTNGTDGTWTLCVNGNTSVVFDEGPVYLRQVENPTHFILLDDIPAPAEPPAFSIDFKNEQTNEPVPESIEYCLNYNDFSEEYYNCQDGNGENAKIFPYYANYFFRVRATDTTLAGEIFPLEIPERPPAPDLPTINFIDETTNEPIGVDLEYLYYGDTMYHEGQNEIINIYPSEWIYFRKKATNVTFASDINELYAPSRPWYTNYKIDFVNEQTDKAVSSADEFSNYADMQEAISGVDDYINLLPGIDIYFRKKATTTSFSGYIQHLIIPPRPPTPVLTIDYPNERTVELLDTLHEYADNEEMSSAVTGDNNYVSLFPGSDVYFRVRITDTSFSSLIYRLDVPERPAITNYEVNFYDETTGTVLLPEHEYADNQDMTSAIQGTNEVILLAPGNDIYIRYSSTSSSFSGIIQHLVVPDRPPAPNYTIDFSNETTVQSVSMEDEYSYQSDFLESKSGQNLKIVMTPGKNVYLRKKATVSSFSGQVLSLIVPDRPPIPIVSLSGKNDPEAIFMKSLDGTGDPVDITDGYECSVNFGVSWDQITPLTEVDASGMKHIIVREKSTSVSFASLPTSNLDYEIPTISIVTEMTCNGPGDEITVQSNLDNGSIYFVLEGIPQADILDIKDAVAAGQGASAEVNTPFADIVIPTMGLIPGTYHGYATNDWDSLSEMSFSSVVIYGIPDVDLGEDIIKCQDTEISLDAGPGFSKYLWSYESSDNQVIQVTEENEYIVYVTDEHGCINSDTVYVKYNIPYPDEQLCIVTVSLATGKNLLVWEKTPDVGTIAYNLYRESTIGKFDLIGTVAADKLSIFLDTVADPESQTYLYKITSIDSCNNESDIENNRYHKPIFLQYVSSEGGVNLEWTDYEIEDVDDIKTYLSSFMIYRGTDSTGLSEYKTVGSINNYTDTDPIAMEHRYYYRVAGILTDPCYPTGAASKKADSGPYSHSMSNIEDNRIQETPEGISRFRENEFKIVPNPFNESTILIFDNPEGHPYTLYIIDLSGKICRIVENITASEYVLKREVLKEGFYFLELRGPELLRGRMVIE
ncbi:MAG: hypothetical protein AMS27_13945 [Bacteroides sp. SM23_62_1]|nr:MAG: hypothetical protein AMS27_13945 [Bacteroides sp. SM23_62_1]